jgi:hypothetical protein
MPSTQEVTITKRRNIHATHFVLRTILPFDPLFTSRPSSAEIAQELDRNLPNNALKINQPKHEKKARLVRHKGATRPPLRVPGWGFKNVASHYLKSGTCPGAARPMPAEQVGLGRTATQKWLRFTKLNSGPFCGKNISCSIGTLCNKKYAREKAHRQDFSSSFSSSTITVLDCSASILAKLRQLNLSTT